MEVVFFYGGMIIVPNPHHHPGPIGVLEEMGPGSARPPNPEKGQKRPFFDPLFSVKFLPRIELPNRFAFVVSTKVSKKAVVRNRLKRILREFVRRNLANFAVGDYVVIVKPAAAKKPEKSALSAFQSLVVDKGLLKSF